MSTKPKVLIIENSIHVTGALKSVTRTAFDVRGRFDFMFVIPRGSMGRSWIEGKGFKKIFELRFIEISRRFISLLLYLPYLVLNGYRIARICRREKVDLIHVNDLYNLAVVTARWFGCKVPYITHIRFLPDKFPPRLFKFWLNTHLRFANQVVCVSHYLKDQLPDHEKIIVIHNELPVEERYPQGLPGHAFPTILYLSNVIRGKGHEFALQAFARIHHQFPKWQLRFVGGDMGLKKNAAYREELKLMANTLGIAHKITWVDFVEDVEREYRRADLVLNFSESESFSISCLEALYFGRPMIASRCGGPPEIIDDRETGLLVDNGNVDQMVEALFSLLSHPQLREEMGKRAAERVRVKFCVENTSYKLSKSYELALGMLKIS